MSSSTTSSDDYPQKPASPTPEEGATTSPSLTINAAKLNPSETPEQVKARNLKAALERAAQTPAGGFKPVDLHASSPPPSPQQQQQPSPLPFTPQQIYEQGKVDGYLAGFVGCAIILVGGYLGYRGVSWACGWGAKPAAKVAAAAVAAP